MGFRPRTSLLRSDSQSLLPFTCLGVGWGFIVPRVSVPMDRRIIFYRIQCCFWDIFVSRVVFGGPDLPLPFSKFRAPIRSRPYGTGVGRGYRGAPGPASGPEDPHPTPNFLSLYQSLSTLRYRESGESSGEGVCRVEWEVQVLDRKLVDRRLHRAK